MKHLRKITENFNDDINILLAQRIDIFIERYAGIKPDYDEKYDDIDDKYTSPDVYEMIKCSDMLKNRIKPDYCFSDWGSGGYKPYLSVEGEEEHNSILNAIELLNK